MKERSTENLNKMIRIFALKKRGMLFLICCFISAFNPAHAQEYKQHLELSYAELDSCMYVFYDKGDFYGAIPFMEAGKEKAAAEFGELDTTYAEYMNNLAFFYAQTGQYNEALPLFIQAVDIKGEILGKEHVEYAASLSNLAIIYENIDKKDKALKCHVEALNIKGKALGKDHPSYALSLNNLGQFYTKSGDYDNALSLFVQAIAAYENSGSQDDPYLAVTLNNLADAHYRMKNYDKALPLYVRFKELNEGLYGNEHPSYALSLNNLAGLYQNMGQHQKALPLHLRANNIFEKTLGKDHPSYATSLNNIAVTYEEMKAYGKALPIRIQAVKIQQKALGKEHSTIPNLLHNLAGLYELMGENAKGLPLQIEAVAIVEKTLGRRHPEFPYSLNNLVASYKKMKNYNKAWEELRNVFEVCSQLAISTNIDQPWFDSLTKASYPSNEHLKEMIRALDFAYSMLNVDKTNENAQKKQVIVADLAHVLLAKLRQEMRNEKDKLRMLSLSNDWLEQSLRVLNPQEDHAKAFDLSDQNKSVLLLQATKSEEVYHLGELPDSLIQQDKKMLKKQKQIQAELLEKRTDLEQDNLRQDLIKVNQEIEGFIKTVKQDYPKYHQLKYQTRDVTAKEIQEELDEQTALLEFVMADSMVHIFYLDKESIQWDKFYVSNRELDNRIKSLHHALSDYKLVLKSQKKAYREYTNHASWFYKNLLKGVLKDKKNIQNLIFITDGELGHLPFETFLVEIPPQDVSDYHELHYLVQDYNISYNYSATVWKENIKASIQQNNGQILAMAANYEMPLDSALIDARLVTDRWLRKALKPLPAARKEVETLEKEFEGFFAFDSLATEKTVKEMAPKYAIIHLAMHGILDSKRPVLSSLAFTEDSDPLESNFWQAHEISKMELHADLVVLSACETGFGKFERGNGIASLARAFMYAGASSLIVSLWQVNDYATSEIMKNLYRNLADGMKKDEALRQAKQVYLKSANGILAHPAFWSPFIQMGNTEAVQISRKGSFNKFYLWIGMGLIALLGIGGLVIRRRTKAA